MAELKELKRLKDEERSLMNIASKLSDQLNRLKVEELALLSMLHKEGLPANTMEDTDARMEEEQQDDQSSSQQVVEKTEELVPLDLHVKNSQEEKEFEEEEEEEEDDDLTMMMSHFNDGWIDSDLIIDEQFRQCWS